MKVRVMTALVLLCILAVVLFFLDTLLLNAVVGLISILAVIELLKATNLLRFQGLTALALLQAVILPFVRAGWIGYLVVPILFLVILGYFLLLVKNYGTLKVEHCAMAFLFSTIVPLFFSCAVHIRDDHGLPIGGFYLIMALGAGWVSDTGAYFIGTFFGKRKLSPQVSPNKTVEGTIGGVASCAVFLLLLAFVYARVLEGRFPWVEMQVNYLMIGLLSPVLSLIGVLGDLSASAIKREYGVKDFGHLMPGHGGIMDRFDSVLFTLPAVYAIASHMALFVAIYP